MENVLTYKGFTGIVKLNTTDKVLHGKIEFVNDLVTFEATAVDELETAFREAVDDYIEMCKSWVKSP